MYAHEYHKQLEQIADLQARLAQCEGEKVALAHDRDNWLYRCHSVEDERTELRAERDAALERVREVEKGLQFIMFHIEAPQDSDIPADQYIPTLSEAVVCRNEIQRLLALRAGMR